MSELSEAIKKYKEKRGLSFGQLAEEWGIPLGTLKVWLYRDKVPKNRHYLGIIKQYFPEILTDNSSSNERPIIEIQFPEREEFSKEVDEIELKVKTILIQDRLSALEELVSWFLFKATVNERNYFRKILGERWNKFVDLARALRTETTFEILEKEGKLE